MVIEATADCLASLLVLEAGLERIPEPFRMQPRIRIEIGFQEYVDFIYMLPEESSLLYSTTSKLRGAKPMELLKSFYTDVALGVGKELYFAERAKKPATVIRHTIKGCRTPWEVKVSNQADPLLRSMLEAKGFALERSMSSTNSVHWAYACKLISGCLGLPQKWVEI